MALLIDASAWLNTQAETAAGVTVTYTRKAGGTSSVLAVRGQSTFTTVIDGAIERERTDRDYLILASRLSAEPDDGDRITDDGETYEAMLPNDGDPPWRWHDVEHTTYRIHCKRVS